MPLLFEMRARKAWQLLGTLEPGQDGSVSHNGPAGREIYRFRCLGDRSLLERSAGGADTEIGPLRAISSTGFEEIAHLEADGSPFEMWLKTDRMPEPVRIRFRHT